MKKNKLVICILLLLLLNFPKNAYANLIINTNNLEVKINEGNVKIDSLKEGEITIEVEPNKEATPEVTSNASDSKNLTIWGQIIPIGIISSFISALVTFIIYYLNRRNAKIQIKFDLALKQLLPSVYIPLVNELRNKELRGIEIDFNKINKVILENLVMLTFAPKQLKEIIDKLYIECQSINSPTKYKEKEPELIRLLKQVEEEIIKRFGALKG